MLKKIFKKKQKGFTLTELLGVVVILLTIVLVAVPTIGSTMEKNKNRILEQKKKMIISAAEVYASNNKKTINYDGFLNGSCYISVLEIKNAELLTESELTDANNKEIVLKDGTKIKEAVVKFNDNELIITKNNGYTSCIK